MARHRKGGVAKTTVELPAPLHRKLRVKAALENRTINDIMVDCVQQCLADFHVDPTMFGVEAVPRDQAREAASSSPT